MKAARSCISVLAAFAFMVTVAQADSLYDAVMPKAGKQVSAPYKQAPGIRAYQQQKPLHGNSNSKIYHASDCEHYNAKSCTVQFATAAEAEKAGYHACKVCGGKEGVATANKMPRTLKGNPNSKMLHGPSCKYYDAKGTTEKFANLDQAIKKGYKLCSVCEGK
ncbi:MAG: hypothetical protein J6I40_08765 [Mailhella sp.]|nr:hypothetical protein [Mailhella sp.]